jgi:hypothetical protein
MPAKITVRLQDGKVIEHQVQDYPGLASRPFTWDDSVEKFDRLVAGRVDEGLGCEIKDAVRSVENIRVRDLMKLLGRATASKPETHHRMLLTATTDTTQRGENEMAITPENVREIFKGLETGDGAGFFKHVADDVDWIVEGTHPLAGHYNSKKAFIEGTFAKLAQVLPQGAELETEHVLVKDDQAVVELHSLATARNGMRFDNRYCWVVYFQDGVIVRVRAYLDSAMVARLFEENPIAPSTEAA